MPCARVSARTTFVRGMNRSKRRADFVPTFCSVVGAALDMMACETSFTLAVETKFLRVKSQAKTPVETRLLHHCNCWSSQAYGWLSGSPPLREFPTAATRRGPQDLRRLFSHLVQQKVSPKSTTGGQCQHAEGAHTESPRPDHRSLVDIRAARTRAWCSCSTAAVTILWI